jgi:predicted CXXCH cytochrome family protein
MRGWLLASMLATTLTLIRVPVIHARTASGGGVHPVPVTAEQASNPAFCFGCHTDKNSKFTHSVIAASTCTACHSFSVQGEETRVTLIDTGRELCLQCHADKDTSQAKGLVHKPVADDCITCHNPHSTPFKNELIKATVGYKKENLCLDCHSEGASKPVDGASRHGALDLGCDTCHTTHKTGDPASKEFAFHLTKPAPALCLDCHFPADKKIQEAHDNQPFEKSDCTSCHDPHESPSPKLLYATTHEPYQKKQCAKCHQPAQNGEVVLTEGGNRALCYNCHDSKKAQVERSRTKHPVPFMTETCTDCHDPHASKYASLLRKPQAQICANCHEKSTLPVQHGPYQHGQCTDCHDPHGSNEPQLLRATGNTLCRACHVTGQSGLKFEAKTVVLPWKETISAADYEAAPKLELDSSGETGHPIVGHPLSGVNNLASENAKFITCSTCHSAHSSKSAGLLPAKVNDSIQLCEECHKTT